jgi:hypothetical protein
LRKHAAPQRALKLLFDWLDIHKQELLLAWEKAQKGEPLEKIEPLK